MKPLRLIFPILLTIVGGLLLRDAVGAATQQTYQVTDMFDSDDGVCDAHCSLREAVQAANENPSLDRINLPTGGFFNFVTLTLGELTISDDVYIYCGDWLIDVSGGNRGFVVADGVSLELGICRMRGGEAAQGGFIYNSGALSITNGLIVNNEATVAGGAIYNDGGSVLLRFADVEENSAENGAVLYNAGGNVTIINTDFQNNVASANGGVLHQISGTMRVVGSEFVGNSADLGGAVYQVAGDLTFSQTVLTANSATSSGGALYNVGDFDNPALATVRVFSSTIQQNNAESAAGIDNFFGNLIIQGSNVFSNVAVFSGGGIQNGAAGTLHFSRTVLAGNVVGTSDAGGNGAGIYNFGRTTAFSLTVHNNEAYFGTSGSTPFVIRRGNGGGIYNNGMFSMTHSSVRDNIGEYGGGGLYNSGNFSVTRSIISNNFDGGIVIEHGGAFSITRSTVAQNADGGIVADGVWLFVDQTTVDDNGEHGISASNGRVTLHNTTISNNANNGVRIQGFPGYDSPVNPFGDEPPTFVAADILHLTVAGNGDEGVAIGSNGTLSMTNVLIGNTGSAASCVTLPNSGGQYIIDENAAQFSASATNLDHDGSCDAATTGDAALGQFADYGGWNWTYELLEFSDAIDLGDAAACAAVGSIDQRGFVRTGSCDVGAVERASIPTAVQMGEWGANSPITTSNRWGIVLFFTLFLVWTIATRKQHNTLLSGLFHRINLRHRHAQSISHKP